MGAVDSSGVDPLAEAVGLHLADLSPRIGDRQPLGLGPMLVSLWPSKTGTSFLFFNTHPLRFWYGVHSCAKVTKILGIGPCRTLSQVHG